MTVKIKVFVKVDLGNMTVAEVFLKTGGSP